MRDFVGCSREFAKKIASREFLQQRKGVTFKVHEKKKTNSPASPSFYILNNDLSYSCPKSKMIPYAVIVPTNFYCNNAHFPFHLGCLFVDSHFGLLRPDIHGIVGTFRDEFCKPFKRPLHTIKNESSVGNSKAFGTGRYLRKKRIGNMVLHMQKAWPNLRPKQRVSALL